jgi:hypothetical protein
MAKLVWDETGKHFYETGTDRAVLFPQTGSDGAYGAGVAWSGLTGVTESPSGADETALYADNQKYLSLRSAEEFGGTITAYQYPDEWEQCDGSAELTPGVVLGQQTRTPFGLCYRTLLGNDAKRNDYGYKLHFIYNATVSPSERAYQTVNDSPEAIEFSWEFDTTPINVDGFKSVSCITVDSTKVSADALKKLEDMVYGTADAEPQLPLPADFKTIFAAG